MSVEVGFLLACVAFGGASYSVWLYYSTQFLGRFRVLNPLVASDQFSPVVVSGLCTALTAGFILS